MDFCNLQLGRIEGTSKEYIKVIIVHEKMHFLIPVYEMYVNIASYLYGKQIKSESKKKAYLWIIFICKHLILRYLH